MSRFIQHCRFSKRLNSGGEIALATVAFFLATGILAICPARGADDRGSAVEPGQSKEERAARLEAMRRRAASLIVKATNAAAEFADVDLVNPPLLAYNNHANVEIDATLWAWGKTGRPVAVAAIHEDHGPKHAWSCEMVSLAEEAVSITGKPGWEWTPAKSGIDWKSVPAAPAPGKTAVVRSAQMKDIANRFTSTGYYRNGNVVELRLMGKPLHRYADPDNGLVDGAIMGFVEGTNPETLLLIECRSDQEKKPGWVYGLARMSGGRLVARIEDTVVWECPDTRGFDPDRSYSSYNGPHEIVFGNITEAPPPNDK